MANDGKQFQWITGGDGPGAGYIGVNRGSDSALYQDVGPLHAGSYAMSVGMSLPVEQEDLARDNPASVLLRLERVGVWPGGSVNDSDLTILGESQVDSRQLTAGSFTCFSATADVPELQASGGWLRIALFAPGELAEDSMPWSVMLDRMTVAYADTAGTVLEPGSVLPVLLAAAAVTASRRHCGGRCRAPRRVGRINLPEPSGAAQIGPPAAQKAPCI